MNQRIPPLRFETGVNSETDFDSTPGNNSTIHNTLSLKREKETSTQKKSLFHSKEAKRANTGISLWDWQDKKDIETI